MRSILLALVACVVVACGGGGGGNPGGGDDDDTPPTDGPDNPLPDSPPTVNSALGTTCTPDANNPQGDCPAGFECLNLQGATNPWCSKTCTMGAGDMCSTDYDGPGKAACILQVGPEGGPTENFCAVICQDTTGRNLICPADQCDGNCSGSLACTADLPGTVNGQNQIVGKICE